MELQTLIQTLLDPAHQLFWQENQDQDPFIISKQAHRYPQLHVQWLAQQIERHQYIRQKMPSWAVSTRILLPPRLHIEQASSQATARFKQWLLSQHYRIQGIGADLTGGLGIDSFFLAQALQKWFYVEKDSDLAGWAKHNFAELKSPIEVLVADGADFLRRQHTALHVVYIDPARRSNTHRRVWKLADCSPDVCQWLPLLQKHCHYVLLKLSPMLDLNHAQGQLSPWLQDWWIVSHQGECKELLAWLDMHTTTRHEPRCYAVQLDSTTPHILPIGSDCPPAPIAMPANYIYEPNAALMKAQAWAFIAHKYHVHKLNHHTHLFSAQQLVSDFPGRIFRLKAKLPFDKKQLHKHLPTQQAHILLRNVPFGLEEVKKKLQLREGGNHYLWCVRLADERIHLLLTERVA